MVLVVENLLFGCELGVDFLDALTVRLITRQQFGSLRAQLHYLRLQLLQRQVLLLTRLFLNAARRAAQLRRQCSYLLLASRNLRIGFRCSALQIRNARDKRFLLFLEIADAGLDLKIAKLSL